MRQAILKLIALSILFLLVPTLVCAQEVASLTGTVTDSTGAVVPGVEVTLVNTNTNTTYTAKTISSGAYTISKLLPGPGYKLIFKKQGFDTVVVNNLYIAVGTTRTQNAELRVGKVSETVEVSAVSEGVTLDTSTATVGTNLNMTAVSQLPTQLRDNPAALLTLQPGVISATGGADATGSRAGAVTGARGDQNNVTLDGLDVNDFSTGQAFVVVANAPIDSIQEFRGETANSLAASGRGSGGQIQMVTKSGTNQFHGSVSEYNRNTYFAANNYFNNLNGIDRPKLIRNQFGATAGGPIIKDKLFFFTTYNARRDARAVSTYRIVPLDNFRQGNIGYILSTATDGSGACSGYSRQNTTPACIAFANAATVAALDPQHAGLNTSLMSFVNDRYPEANDLTLGDGINTGGFRFNAPRKLTENNYVTKIDYNMNSKMRVFGRFTILRQTQGDAANFSAPIQFPGDPLTHTIEDKSYQYVLGHTWTISPTKVNNFAFGESVSKLSFPTNYNPMGSNYWSSFGILTAPYSDQGSQARSVPIPIFRDDFTWQRGNHNIQIGGTFKPIKTNSNLGYDQNFISLGMGGLTSSLSASLRPADIRTAGTLASSDWDSAFAFALGRFAEISSNYNYDSSLNVLPQGTGATRQYRYYEYEGYGQDTWKVNNALTLTLGLRYQYYSVPYEVNGIQAVQNVAFDSYLAQRAFFGQHGVSGDGIIDFITYDLGGKANKGGRSLYKADRTNFAPRFSFAYNPNFGSNFLGRIFGDRKTVLRGGAGIVYDHPVTSALNFIQDQNSYMFQSSSTRQYGSLDPNAALLNDPRFTSLTTLPALPAAPVISRPYTPYVDAGFPYGTAENDFNYAIDPYLKNPYSIVMTFGFQRELPGHFVLESTYVGRLGRRLIAQADASQLVDFKDSSSGQMMSAAFAGLTRDVRAGGEITPQPWFENQMFPGGTELIASAINTLAYKGDVADIVQALLANGLIANNVGLAAQFAGNTYITNKGSSNYHGLLTSLHKNLSNGLQFDLNYTFSHSIDNASGIANSIASSDGIGFICDAQNLRICRSNSDFDVKHILTANFVYDLPFGKGKALAGGASNALNQVIGGWTLSGIPAWRSGIAFSAVTGAYLMGYANNAPAIFNGDHGALSVNVHQTADGTVQMFSDPERAASALSGPVGFTMGSRNVLRGPGYFNLDLALRKKFPITERVGLTFSTEAYNVFNHANFALPGGGGTGSNADITTGSFGQITTTVNANREMQFGLKLEF